MTYPLGSRIRQAPAPARNAVLKSVREAVEHCAAGVDVAVCRSLVDELVPWFPGHADYMDASLAQWIVKQRQGGMPVVVQRGILEEPVMLAK